MPFDINKARQKGIDEKSIAIMERINANKEKRDSCKGHDFEHPSQLFGKYRCKNCGCEEDVNYVNGYQDALRHKSVDKTVQRVFEPVWDAGEKCDLKCPELFYCEETCDGCEKAEVYAYERDYRDGDLLGITVYVSAEEALNACQRKTRAT